MLDTEAIKVFDSSAFSFWNVVFTAAGALVFWGVNGRSKLRAYMLSDLIGKFVKEEKYCMLVELLVFVAFGVLIGIGFTQPTNPRQAVTAGLAWTGFCSVPRARSSPEQKK